MSKWESEFNQLMSAERDEVDHDYGSEMQQTWENGVGNFSGTVLGDTGLKFDSDGMPILGEYTFGTMVMISCFSGIDLPPFRTKQQAFRSSESPIVSQ